MSLGVKNEIVEHKAQAIHNWIIFGFLKVLDTVWHDLLMKLENYEIWGAVSNIIRSYLCKRRQYVYINNISSGLLLVKHGIHRGSILGPLYFIIYINDITHIPDSTKVMIYTNNPNTFSCETTKDDLEDMANIYLRDYLYDRNE